MTTSEQDSAVRRTVTVPIAPAEAFAAFTERFGEFKPPEHNMMSVPIAQTVLEPFVGGGIIDRGVDGSECRWARILAFEPPGRLVFSWDISPTWQVETDLARSSEVEVRFLPDGEHSTRVELEHRHLDRHGPGWETLRDAVDSDGGWPLYVDGFAALITATAARQRGSGTVRWWGLATL